MILTLDFLLRRLYNSDMQYKNMVEKKDFCMNDQILYEKITALVDRSENVDYSIQLPETEFDVMCAVWDGEWPLTTGYLMQVIGSARGWKTPTLISFLVRLEERGFIGSIKKGRDRYYFPLADKELYLQAVTRRFTEKYHGNSFISILNSLYPDRKFSEKDIDLLLNWLRTRE